MVPPLISYVVNNRLGMTAINLLTLLNSSEDFELHIVDCNSSDNTWYFLECIDDERIKSKTRLNLNRGWVYATNLVLSKRSPNQIFISVNNDTYINTPNWIQLFVNSLNTFSEVGLLGTADSQYYDRHLLPLIKWESSGVEYLQSYKSHPQGYCQCFRPELLDLLGYYSEENCMGEIEMCHRIQNHTKSKIGFLPAIEVCRLAYVPCEICAVTDLCDLDKERENCFQLWKKKNAEIQFKELYKYKFKQCLDEMREGKRNGYCGSVHDPQSMRNHYYNYKMAFENFDFFKKNSN